MNIKPLLNDFATRSFRDVADQDYIAARLSYRHGLIPQFHWQALQALEKYIKAILLYNRIKAKDINHDWLIMDSGLLAKEQPQEGIQEVLPSIFCVMNELEKAEIDGKVFLGDPPVRP